MYREKNTPFQLVAPTYEEPLSGVVNSAMPAGSLVALKDDGTLGAENEFVLCGAGQRPAILESNVVSDADWQAYMKADPRWRSNIRTPIPVGQASSARFAKYAEYEGTTFFNGVDGNTAAKTPLKVVAGKFNVATVAIPDGGGTADRVVAYLVKKVAPHDPATFRWLVEFVG
jgi:hypothetical protein